MARKIQRVKYFHASVLDSAERACQLVVELAASEVNLLAFAAWPMGPEHTQLELFPEKPELLERFAYEKGVQVTGPVEALLIQGDDELGVLADIHKSLADAGICAYSSHGVSDGRGGFGYVIYLRAGDLDKAYEVLGV